MCYRRDPNSLTVKNVSWAASVPFPQCIKHFKTVSASEPRARYDNYPYIVQDLRQNGVRYVGQGVSQLPQRTLPLKLRVTVLGSLLHPSDTLKPGVVVNPHLEYRACGTDKVNDLRRWISRDIISSVHDQRFKVTGLHLLVPETGEVVAPDPRQDLADLGEELGVITDQTWMEWVDGVETLVTIVARFSNITLSD